MYERSARAADGPTPHAESDRKTGSTAGCPCGCFEPMFPAPGIVQGKAVAGVSPLTVPRVSAARADEPPGGAGRPLDGELKSHLEGAFERRLDHVRVHDDSASRSFVRSRMAHAVTIGSRIYLGPGRWRSRGDAYMRTMAHEVAHTIHQQGADSRGQAPSAAHYMALEREADQAADGVMRGRSAPVIGRTRGGVEQADGNDVTLPTQVRWARNYSMLMGISASRREILMDHPAVYREVVQRRIQADAEYVKDKVLEVHVSDSDEWNVVREFRRWAMTPKIEGGNYLDEFMDRLRNWSYWFDYLVSESARGSVLDKVYAELEDDRYRAFLSIVDTFSLRYRGYRGRGGINRLGGVGTGLMPSRIRDRISRLNLRLAGRQAIPMTRDDLDRLNTLYARLRRETWGLVDMPFIYLTPARGQHAAPLVIAGVVIAADVVILLEAIVLAILVTATLVIVAMILDELTRILDRADRMPYSQTRPPQAEPTTRRTPAPETAPNPQTPGPGQGPGPGGIPWWLWPVVAGGATTLAGDQPVPGPEVGPQPGPEVGPQPGPDVGPDTDSDDEERRRRRCPKPFVWETPYARENVIASGGVDGVLDFCYPTGFSGVPSVDLSGELEGRPYDITVPQSQMGAHGHHPWPKFLGGDHRQPLMAVRYRLHISVLHPSLDLYLGAHGYIGSHATTRAQQDFHRRLATESVLRQEVKDDLIAFYQGVNSATYPQMPAAAYERGIRHSFRALGGG